MADDTLRLALALALLPVGVLAQDTPQAEFQGEIQVTEVLLDVLVSDSAGNIILGLEKDDFVVKEEGKSVEIAELAFYSNRRLVEDAGLASAVGVSSADIPVDRYFILFFHDQRMVTPTLFQQQLQATRKAERWVQDELLQNDYVAVASYDSKLKVHQDFTTDRGAILRALQSIAKVKEPGTEWPSRWPQGTGPSLLKNLPQGKNMRKETVRVEQALTVLARAAGHIQGRKNLVFFSVGFGDSRGLAQYTPDPRYYPAMMQELNDRNVAVYAISMFGVLEAEALGYDPVNSLTHLATDTGGKAYVNFLDFRRPLREVAEDNNGYYLLSYRAERPAGESGFAEVEVGTVNPDFVVRARRGYRYGS